MLAHLVDGSAEEIARRMRAAVPLVAADGTSLGDLVVRQVRSSGGTIERIEGVWLR